MNYATDFHPYGGMWGEGRLPESDASVLSLIVARSLLSIRFGFVFDIVNQLSIEVDSHKNNNLILLKDLFIVYVWQIFKLDEYCYKVSY